MRRLDERSDSASLLFEKFELVASIHISGNVTEKSGFLISLKKLEDIATSKSVFSGGNTQLDPGNSYFLYRGMSSLFYVTQLSCQINKSLDL